MFGGRVRSVRLVKVLTIWVCKEPRTILCFHRFLRIPTHLRRKISDANKSPPLPFYRRETAVGSRSELVRGKIDASAQCLELAIL